MSPDGRLSSAVPLSAEVCTFAVVVIYITPAHVGAHVPAVVCGVVHSLPCRAPRCRPSRLRSVLYCCSSVYLLARSCFCIVCAQPVRPSVAAVNENTQFWDQAFRRQVRQNTRVGVRPPGTYDFTRFPRFQSLIDAGAVPFSVIQLVVILLAFFFKRLNIRFACCWDYLEAFVVFDPRPVVRVKTKSMVRTYLVILLKRFKLPPERAALFDADAIVGAALHYYAMTSDEDGYAFESDEVQPIGRYYG